MAGGRRNPFERPSSDAGLAGHPTPHRQLRQPVVTTASLCKLAKTPLRSFMPQRSCRRQSGISPSQEFRLSQRKAGGREDNSTEDSVQSRLFINRPVRGHPERTVIHFPCRWFRQQGRRIALGNKEGGREWLRVKGGEFQGHLSHNVPSLVLPPGPRDHALRAPFSCSLLFSGFPLHNVLNHRPVRPGHKLL